MDSKRKPSRPKSKRPKGKKAIPKATATDCSIDASATSDAGNSAAADSFLEHNSLMDNASESQAPSIDGLGVSDMELVSPLNDDDFCDFDGSDGEELLNALSDDEGMDFALNHFEEEDRRQQQLQSQQPKQSQGRQETHFHQIDQVPPPLRHRCHSDPLLNSFTDGDYFFNNNINKNHSGNHGNDRDNSNDNVDAATKLDQDTDPTPFHPSIFLTTTAPLPRRSSDGFDAPNRNNFDAGDFRRGGDKGATNNAKPRRKARKNRNLKDVRGIKSRAGGGSGAGTGAGGEPLFGAYSRAHSGNNGEDDDGMSDVASACSAPAQLLDSGFFDNPTLNPHGGRTFTSHGGRDSNNRRDGGGGEREEAYDGRYQDEQQAGHRRRKSAPLGADFWGDHDNSTAGSSQGDSSYAHQGHGNQRQHHIAAAPIKRRKSDPLISLSDFWNNTNYPGGGARGVAGHHNFGNNSIHNFNRNLGGGGVGNEGPNAATFLQNMANFEQSSHAEQELSSIIAVAREAQDKINRLKAFLSGTPPPSIFGGHGGLGSGHPAHPAHPAQLLGGNNLGAGFNPMMYYPGNYNHFGRPGNGPNVPQIPQNLGMLPGMGHRSMAAHSVQNNVDLSNFDGNALALSAANYATPQSVMNEASSPKGNRGKSSSKKAPDSAKKKRAIKKPSAKSPTSSLNPKPAATPKPTPEVTIPKIDPDTLSKLDPETVMASLQAAMEKTKDTQQQLQEWDRANGLPKSHSQTMVNSSRSRKQLAEGVILKKWNGTPLIDLADNRKLENGGGGSSGDESASAPM
ncbi:hypothetical protein ACHAXS_003052 [Conticribra weissflogii]